MSYMVSLMASLLVNLPALRASCHDLEKSELLRAHSLFFTICCPCECKDHSKHFTVVSNY